ncbi:MAG: pilin [Candidatus Paceibacterota bacterium]
MTIKKELRKMFLIIFLFMTRDVYAAGYEPLVHIPGLPEGGVIDISAYLIGIYNFLLSIVGIVAVIMLIIGGMRYITAAGNSGAVTSAKDTIWSALSGLMLALLSWVIVSTINPDVLYLRQPGAALENTDISTTNSIDQCWASYDSAQSEDNCVCNNGYTTNAATEKTCQVICSMEERCTVADPNYCIASGSTIGSTDKWSYNGYCDCATGSRIILPEGETSCQEACLDANECGYKFLAIKMNARHGYLKDEGEDSVYVTSATESPSDKLYELMLTNNGRWDAFDIDSNATFTNENGAELTCAILVTDEDGWAGLDEHMVYWVREGTVVGLKENLFKDINGNYEQCCDLTGGSPECQITWGECGDHLSTENIFFARYSYDIEDKCVSCNIADDDGDGKAYALKRNIRCVNGYWK